MIPGQPIEVVLAHAEGEVGHVIVGGVAPPPGDTLMDQRTWLAQDGRLRDFVLREPRGGLHVHCNLVVPPKNPAAVAGFLVMEPVHTPMMSGSNAMCVATALINTGRVPITGPLTRFYLEAPAGLIEIEARVENGKAQSIRLQNVPSFVDALDAALEVEGHGTLTVDTAYGGDTFVLVDAGRLGFALTPDEGAELVALGARLISAANAQLGFAHPDWPRISFCQFTNPVHSEGGVLRGQSTVVIEPGKLDRSPCGTGCSARMAVLHAKGQLTVGAQYIGTSIIGSEFHCRIASETQAFGQPAIVPDIRGRAWVMGTSLLTLDPDDPFARGYRVGDTWPMG